MNAWMHVAGWVLVHFVWQGAVIALVAALVLHLCRHQSGVDAISRRVRRDDRDAA